MRTLILSIALVGATVTATGCDDDYVVCDHNLPAAAASDGTVQIGVGQAPLDDANGDGVLVICVRA
jgi:hypothetical protein